MSTVLGIFTAFGLSSSAGLNAYIPLLVVALLARFTDLITLKPPWDALTNWWVIGVLAALLIVEIVVDKIPAVDSINDVVQSFIRPAAGAVLFAAGSGAIGNMHPALALICGLLAAGSVHAVKATARPLVTGTTGGILNPVVSTAEDVVSLIVSILAIVVPILAVVLLVMVIVWLIRRRRRRREQAAAWW